MNYLVTCLFLSALQASAVEKLPLAKNYWKSDAFVKQFNGSYRINSAIEPYVTSAQRAELVAMQKLMKQGKRKQVITKLKASPTLKASAALQFNLANVYFEEAKHDEAIQHYSQAIKLLPSFLRAHQNLAYCYVQKDDWEKAYTHLIQAVKLGSRESSTLGLLGYAYQEKQMYQAALTAFKNAQLTDPEQINWKVGAAYALHQTGKLKEALAAYESIVRTQPKADYQLQLASLYQELGMKQKAMTKLELLRRKKQLSPENQLLLARLYFEQGITNVGASMLRQLVKGDTVKGSTKHALKATQHALDFHDAKLAKELHGLLNTEQLKPEQRREYDRLLAQIYLAQGSQIEAAEKLLKALVKSDPLDSHSLYLLGKTYAQQGKDELAATSFDQGMMATGRYSLPCHLEKAKLMVKQEKYDDAIALLEGYLKRNPDAGVKKYLEAVRAISN